MQVVRRRHRHHIDVRHLGKDLFPGPLAVQGFLGTIPSIP
jgi:hypothetical protein